MVPKSQLSTQTMWLSVCLSVCLVYLSVSMYVSLSGCEVCLSLCECLCVCSEGWVVHGSYITAVNSHCVAELVYTATLVKSGSVMFDYQTDFKSHIFTFEVSWF